MPTRNHTLLDTIRADKRIKSAHQARPPIADIDAEASHLGLLPAFYNPLSSSQLKERMDCFVQASEDRPSNNKHPWNENEKRFANQVAEQLLHAFHRYDAMKFVLEEAKAKREHLAPDDPARSDATRNLQTKAALAGQLHRIGTGYIAQQAAASLVRGELGGTPYTAAEAKGFIGGIIRQCIYSHLVHTGNEAHVSTSKQANCPHLQWAGSIGIDLKNFTAKLAAENLTSLSAPRR